MEWLNVVGTVILGVALRIALPVAGTVLIVLWLRWLDARWQEEAEGHVAAGTALLPKVMRLPCWEINQCSPERRSNCPAYQNGNVPCWQLFRSPEGQLKEECLGCEVFRRAPLPVAV